MHKNLPSPPIMGQSLQGKKNRMHSMNVTVISHKQFIRMPRETWDL